jgi:hypothetical protein
LANRVLLTKASGKAQKEIENSEGQQEINMFGGENNRMLDNFYFRTLLQTVAFLVWLGVSYTLLSL